MKLFSKAIRNKPFAKADPLEQKLRIEADNARAKTGGAVRLARLKLDDGLIARLPENRGVNLGKIRYTGGASELAGVALKQVSGDVMKQLFQSKFENTMNEAKQIGRKRREQLASITDSQMVTLKLR
ncbi:hypothetical protein M5E06_34195 [Azospirillum sp. A1-3]|uniref:hypothetical protein n=1 Tax=Azospirillum sp. A1-3 TaxID=185874 RepID=UPI0020771737|nr:hypothetical protein [Azospirillum sp. A1-3]MCM8739139.1 hypothetical protein [Azospirillum sp. A1-3]